MARKLRLEYAGACYHVINRGNYRRDLFGDPGSARSFQLCLFQAAQRFRWFVHAFAIMRNHFHLALETPEPNLSDGMKWLQGTWAARFNRFRRTTGRPFQGRYRAIHVEPGHALAQVAHYIHLNPVRAKVVSADRILDFGHSSLPLFLATERAENLVAETILRESGDLPDSPAGWQRYIAYLGVIAEENSQRCETRYNKLSQGWAIGSAAFRQVLKKDLATKSVPTERFELLGADHHAHLEARADLWEEQLCRAAKALRTPLSKLSPKKSAQEKVRLAALMKSVSSVSNGWLAERLQMGKAASVSQYVRRFRIAGGESDRRFQAAQSIVNT